MRKTCWVLLLPLFVTVTWAQSTASGQTTSAPPSYFPGIPAGAAVQGQDAEKSAPAESAPAPVVPANLTADVAATSIPSDYTYENTLSGRLAGGGVFDSNLGNWANRSSNGGLSLVPRVQWQQSRSRSRWGIQYAPEMDVYAHKEQYYSGRIWHSEAVTGNLDYLPTSRIHLRARQDYSRTNSPFDVVSHSIPSLGMLNGTTQISVSSITRTTLTSNGNADITLSDRSSFGTSFTSTSYDYDGLSAAQLDLRTSRSMNGSAYYSHQVTPRVLLGVQTNITDLSFGSASAQTRTYGFFASSTLTLSNHSSLMLYGGPELSHSRDEISLLGIIRVPVTQSSWGPAYGGNYSWRSVRTAIGIQAQRQVSTAGLMRSVKMTSGSLTVKRQLNRVWLLSLTGTAGDYNSLSLFSSFGRLRSLYATAELSRQLSRNLSLTLRYDRIYQHASAGYFSYGNHNRAQFLLTYVFSKPLGN